MRNKRWLQIIILGILLFVGCYVIGNTIFGSDGIPKAREKAIEFSLPGMDQKIHKLSDYKGKLVFINFWGTFCPPCVFEMPALQSQYVKWKEQGVTILGVNLGESEVTLKAFVESNKVTFPILYDDNRTIARMYKVFSYPTTIVVKPNGKISDIIVGGMTESQIENIILNNLE